MHLIFIHQAILMNEVNNNAREIYRIIQDLYNLCKHVRFDPCFRVKRKIRLFSFANYRENENMIIYCRRLRDRPIIVITLHSHFFSLSFLNFFFANDCVHSDDITALEFLLLQTIIKECLSNRIELLKSLQSLF